MKLSKKLYSIVTAGLLAFSNVSHAADPVIYDFGTLLTADAGYTAPNTASFAQLSATDSGSGVWTFMLSINNSLFSTFGSSAFIGSMTFDFNPDPLKKPGLVSTFLGSNVDGVTSADITNGTGPSGLSDIDFGTGFGKGANDRLSGNDWVKWSVSGLTAGSSLTNMYLHVQGIGTLAQDYSAKYTPIVSAVPEPETYAMLLAGLGLIGFSARRRKLND